ncbi:hypothetical protein PoB_000384500 [Plakobranchus ocellatus]|uniref:Uncharacterized protein n=1 Tax=Plakobranchus ocellatus TaxID=259542 RepID=A0AAV3Y3C6_9GAST|nr:hypothetical protein PoB_000384500 [Plakobranchus ocellatus]
MTKSRREEYKENYVEGVEEVEKEEKNERARVHNKVISGFQALRQVRAPVAGLNTIDRRVPADLRTDSQVTVPPTP